MKLYLQLILLFIGYQTFGQTADEIINKHFEATGGREKWSKVYSIEYTGNYVMGPGMLAPVKEIIISKPFKGEFSSFTWQGMTSESAMRGDSGWSYNPFGGKRETDPLSPNDIRSKNLDADPQGLLFNYKEKGYTVDYLGTDDVDGVDVYKLCLTTKTGDMVYFYIDEQSYYILKIEDRLKFKDKEQKGYTTFSDFRKTDFGVTVPFSAQSVDEDGNEEGGPVNYTRVEVNGAVDLSLFDKPKQL